MEFIPGLVLIALFVILVVSVTSHLGPAARSLRRLERRFDLLLDHLGAEAGTAVVPATALAEIDEYLANGMTREATRTYAQVSGAERAEAAAWVRQRAESSRRA
ncbi:hypothetical protein [Myceligenerans xiligouense]|uniref:Uncharacterized protein n=1 Tax=Myceligenerans xiligouense TaxID=253184 RepID=A0A3N4YNK2_9MICO|nr:hypothetical protein [Myceligenerans xiligouense]RPF22213.1 hypothetical protein EDD34_2861 [Myceligenerans xiligouense]